MIAVIVMGLAGLEGVAGTIYATMASNGLMGIVRLTGSGCCSPVLTGCRLIRLIGSLPSLTPLLWR